ncbi:hypothetical protein EV696_12243 [Permianibacter aggregans]|uniref:Uncharacterized protein n=1 Tax=Permianibacter aggregans TaxID=1510150 RepID=A0A4V3D6R7_9GAMM|nr:hypothetical protein EV696_12243 [Permianibacter aggregans]
MTAPNRRQIPVDDNHPSFRRPWPRTAEFHIGLWSSARHSLIEVLVTVAPIAAFARCADALVANVVRSANQPHHTTDQDAPENPAAGGFRPTSYPEIDNGEQSSMRRCAYDCNVDTHCWSSEARQLTPHVRSIEWFAHLLPPETLVLLLTYITRNYDLTL